MDELSETDVLVLAGSLWHGLVINWDRDTNFNINGSVASEGHAVRVLDDRVVCLWTRLVAVRLICNQNGWLIALVLRIRSFAVMSVSPKNTPRPLAASTETFEKLANKTQRTQTFTSPCRRPGLRCVCGCGLLIQMHGQGALAPPPHPGNVEKCFFLLQTLSKTSVDEIFMHHFEKMSSASQTLTGQPSRTLLEDFRPSDPLIAPPPWKKFCRISQRLMILQNLPVYSAWLPTFMNTFIIDREFEFYEFFFILKI